MIPCCKDHIHSSSLCLSVRHRACVCVLVHHLQETTEGLPDGRRFCAWTNSVRTVDPTSSHPTRCVTTPLLSCAVSVQIEAHCVCVLTHCWNSIGGKCVTIPRHVFQWLFVLFGICCCCCCWFGFAALLHNWWHFDRLRFSRMCLSPSP